MKLAFIYPGQGSQAFGMGEEFFNSSSAAKEMVEIASESIKKDMKTILFNENENLGKSEFTQPSILLVSAIAHKLFTDKVDIEPVYSLGHSLGEFSALTTSGAFKLSDAIKTVHNRGLWMQEDCAGKDAGMMVVLGLDDKTIELKVKEARENKKSVWAVNYNTDGQLVLAGKKADLAELEAPLKELGAKRAMLLNMSVASHCPMLETASIKLKEMLENSLIDNFSSPIISNVTASKYSTKNEALYLLPQQLTKPVLYKQSIMAIEDEVDMFIEFGHGSVLKGINRKITKKPTISINNMASLEDAIQKVMA